MLTSKLLQLTDELWEAIDYARGETARGPWLEDRLRRLAIVKDAADQLGVEFPERPKPGSYDRAPFRGKPRGHRVKS